MATTVVAPANNAISYAELYLPLLDEAYKAESKSAILDTLSDYIRFTGGNTVNIFNIDPVGMANYNRDAGYVPGDVTGTWQPYVLETDRGRSYQVDFLDNEQAMSLVVPNLLGTVERQHIIPEVDAYRFAAYASGADTNNVVTETLSAGAATVASIDAASVALDNDEVPYEGRILFVSPAVYGLLRGGITRLVPNGEKDVNNMIEVYNDRGTVRIPAFVTDRIIRGAVAMSQGGWYTPDEKGIDRRGSINVLTSSAYPTPLAKGNPQHTNLVEVSKA